MVNIRQFINARRVNRKGKYQLISVALVGLGGLGGVGPGVKFKYNGDTFDYFRERKLPFSHGASPVQISKFHRDQRLMRRFLRISCEIQASSSN